MSRTPRQHVDEVAGLVAQVYEAAGALRRLGDAEAATVGQTQARWQVLSVLADGPQTTPSIAQRLGVTRQNVQQVATRLAADGLVVAKDNPRHERSHLLALTRDGREVLDALGRAAAPWHERAARALAADAVDTTRRTLAQLIELSRDAA